MKTSVYLLLLVICTVVLAAKESHAKKGCSAYGYQCYGGHGKRSLNFDAANNALPMVQQDDLHADGILQMHSNDIGILAENDNDSPYPKYRLIKIIKSWFGGHPRRLSDGIPEIDYPISAENFNNKDNNNNNIMN